MADKPTVFEAWSAVMGDVQAIRKKDRNDTQHFLFRGIDAVMNATGPALRKHGVTIIPHVLARKIVDVQLKSRTATGAHLKVQYTVHGPAGDSFSGEVYAEAMDMGDKATAKAMSVAYRTFLLQALTVPTDEPDPDADTYEREAPARPKAPKKGELSEQQVAKERCRAVVNAYCKPLRLDPNEVAKAYAEQGGKLDPNELRAWLEQTYPTERTDHTRPA